MTVNVRGAHLGTHTHTLTQTHTHTHSHTHTHTHKQTHTHTYAHTHTHTHRQRGRSVPWPRRRRAAHQAYTDYIRPHDGTEAYSLAKSTAHEDMSLKETALQEP